MIELLVSIAIVLFLAALVFSGSSKAIQSANTAKCSTNMRQIGVALCQYIADNDGRFPDNTHIAGATWEMHIMPYLDPSGYNFMGVSGFIGLDNSIPAPAAKLFRCPEDQLPRSPAHYPRTYVLAGWTDNYLYRYSGSLPANVGLKLLLIERPAKSAVLIEAPIPAPNAGTGNILGCISYYCYYPEYSWSDIHSNRSNILFADWHVELVPRSLTEGTLYYKNYYPSESDFSKLFQ